MFSVPIEFKSSVVCKLSKQNLSKAHTQKKLFNIFHNINHKSKSIIRLLECNLC